MVTTRGAVAKTGSESKARASRKATPSRVSKKKSPVPKRGARQKKTSSKSGQTLHATQLTAATNTTSPDFVVQGSNDKALFTLVAYRGEGMCLLAMNWKQGTPPNDFVGFAIEYQEPGGTQFYSVSNRISFPQTDGHQGPNALSSRLSPFQVFRWVHFPFNAGLPGNFTYRVTPVFMDASSSLSYGDFQEAGIALTAETYPGELNICFTRGFISSQAFVDKFGTNGGVGTILPATANAGLDFKPSDPQKEETALAWMGFEARTAILNALDAAVGDTTAQVRVAAYDFNEPEIVSRLEQLKDRLKIIIDDSGSHKSSSSAESKAAIMLSASAGSANVQRQHMGGLQHNKSLVIDGKSVQIAIGGSTNFSWRGLYVQNNNAVILQGASAVKVFSEAFDNMWTNPNHVTAFSGTESAGWNDIGFADINAKVTFSPHSTANAALKDIAADIDRTESSLFYSLAFLYETKGVIQDAIKAMTAKDGIFVYGLSDKSVGGLDLQLPNGNPPVAFPGALLQTDLPPPFKAEATGGNGTRLHHKFVVVDFNKPTARIYTGSYNFSTAADTKNGENLFCIRDQRVATSYMIEALAMFDHYQFRDVEAKSKDANKPIQLQKPPTAGTTNEKPWWDAYWTDSTKQHDRELFGI
ncbi:putative PLD phosphodiesterase domain-containing protein [Seiridium unicorne]|uniref:Mitochondrial cardiolipin hydrolase n=1 Tax=Seiridium unicorne TaxID=138068 RepID=A0ABR2UQQ9_9PEZI